MINKKMLFVFALVFLASLPFLTAGGTCSCEPSLEGESVVCKASVNTFNSTGGLCDVSGYDACDVGYKPQCGTTTSLTCDMGGNCGGCSCVSTTYPYGNTCYDFLNTMSLDGGCAQVTNPPAMNISNVNITEEMGFGEGWNSFLVGVYGDAYCLWEEDNDASRCVACPQGMIWKDSESRCVCDLTQSCTIGTSSCLSSVEEKKCVTNPSGCSVQQTKTCANSEYCGS